MAAEIPRAPTRTTVQQGLLLLLAECRLSLMLQPMLQTLGARLTETGESVGSSATG